MAIPLPNPLPAIKKVNGRVADNLDTITAFQAWINVSIGSWAYFFNPACQFKTTVNGA